MGLLAQKRLPGIKLQNLSTQCIWWGHSSRTEARKSRHSVHSSTPGVWAEHQWMKDNAVLLQISCSFGGQTWEMLFLLSSVRATLNSVIVWAVKQSFCQNHFPLIACLPKMHCSSCPLPDVTEANSGEYQSICCIYFVTSQFDSMLLNNMLWCKRNGSSENSKILYKLVISDVLYLRHCESCVLSPSPQVWGR